MTDTLNRIIYSNRPGEHPPARSSGVTVEEAEKWQTLAPLDPMNEADESASQTLGIFAGSGRDFLLATAYHQDDQVIHEIALLPRKLLHQVAGNLDSLAALVLDETRQTLFVPGATIDELEVSPLLPWNVNDRLKHFRNLLNGFAQGDIDRVLCFLGAAIDERHLLFYAFAGNTQDRLDVVQGLMALLPMPSRIGLTFASHVTTRSTPAIVFTDRRFDTRRWVVDDAAQTFPDNSLLTSPYIHFLRDLWQEDDEAFIRSLADIESLAEILLTGQDMNSGLTKLAEQMQLNKQVQMQIAVDPEALKQVLQSELPLDGQLRRLYARQLLDHALEARDTEAALLVALHMDSDPDLEVALDEHLNAALESQPDAVYVFARTRLNDSQNVTDAWIKRLQTAALVSLRVAINDGDAETIISWLRLIAREPTTYGLADILHEGILAAQERTHADSDLARHLLTLAIKHDPQTLDVLLSDDELLAALPNNMGAVLRDHAGDPLVLLEKRGVETFLVAMAVSIAAQAANLLTPAVVGQIWKIYSTGQTVDLPQPYQPEFILDQLISVDWLPTDSAEHLLTLMLADGHDERFQQLGQHVAERTTLQPLLTTAFQGSQRSLEDIITLGNQLITAECIDPQALVMVYIDLLEQREWRQATLPLVEQLVRMVQQNPDLDLEVATIWKLLDMALAVRSELVARVSVNQIFNDIDQEPATQETDIIDRLAQLYQYIQWSQAAQQQALRWWRDYVRRQPLARLTRLDKGLQGKKALVECRAVVQTTLALRRMLGNRSLEEFAQAINTVFSVLEDIAESFDPSPRQSTHFDEETVRVELDARQAELTDHEWHILAKNFKELAALIGVMGDHRSKGNLVRQNVDQHLLAGEQQPESAVDAMKWIAGYLEGVQDRQTTSGEGK